MHNLPVCVHLTYVERIEAICSHTLAIFIQAQTFGSLCRMSTYTNSVFVTCLKLMSNVFSVHQRTCLISHTSAYVGAIRRSVMGP